MLERGARIRIVKGSQMQERILTLLCSPDLDTVEQGVELLEALRDRQLTAQLAVGVGLDPLNAPIVLKGSPLRHQRHRSLRIRIALWLLRETGRLDALSSLNLEKAERHLRPILSTLWGLPGLKKLTIRADELDDVGLLQPLTGLRWLALRSRPPMALNALTTLSGLENLELHQPNEDLRFLAELTQLKALALYRFKPDQLSVLPRLSSLRRLMLNGPVSDLSWLRGTPGLEVLKIRTRRAPEAYAALTTLTRLRELSLRCAHQPDQVDLSPLRHCETLEKLTLLAHNRLDLSPLHNLPRLRWLGMSHNYTYNDTPWNDTLWRTARPLSSVLEPATVDQTGEPRYGGRPLFGAHLFLMLHIQPPPGHPHPLEHAQKLDFKGYFSFGMDFQPLEALTKVRQITLPQNYQTDTTALALLPALESVQQGAERIEGQEAIFRFQRRQARRFERHRVYHRTQRDEAWLERMRVLGLLGSHNRPQRPAEISRLLASDRLETLLSGFSSLAALPNVRLVQELSAGIRLDPEGQLILSHAAAKRPFLRRKDRRAFCALMAMRVAGRLESVRRIALGPRQPLYNLAPLDGLENLEVLILRGGGKIHDLSPITRMRALRYLDTQRCDRLPNALRAVWEGEALTQLQNRFREAAGADASSGG